MADANNSEAVLVTEEDLQKMQQRLVELNAQVPALSQELNRTRADGDFSENAPLHAAREEMSKLQSAIRDLEAQIHNAVIQGNRTDGRTGLGSKIRIKDANGKEREIVLVSHVEANPPTHISIESPMGEALFDLAPGEVAKFQAPRGEISLEILDVTN